MMTFELVFQIVLGRKVEFYEVDSFVSEILSAAALAHSCPYLHASLQRLFDNETADESAGTSDEN